MARAARGGSAPLRLSGRQRADRDDTVVAVYDGLQKLGLIACGDRIRALKPDGAEIGVFATRDQARAAVMQAAGRSQ